MKIGRGANCFQECSSLHLALSDLCCWMSSSAWLTLYDKLSRGRYGASLRPNISHKITASSLGWDHANRRGIGFAEIQPGCSGRFGAHQESGTRRAAAFLRPRVQRDAVVLNSFAFARGLKYSVTEGKTAELAIEQGRKLFRSVNTGHVVGLRDRARRVGLHRCLDWRHSQTPDGGLSQSG
jgi:hypothetical protein